MRAPAKPAAAESVQSSIMPGPRDHPALVSVLALRQSAERTYPMSMDHASSMLPLLRGGDRIEWQPATIDELRSGQIVFYGYARRDEPPREIADNVTSLRDRLAGELLVVHRIAWKRGAEALITKGDGRPALDVDPVAADHVIGRVVAVHREGRVFRLDTSPARAYGRAAWALSLLGAATYRLAAYADAVLGRVTFRRRAPFLMRPLFDRAQRLAQRALHLLAFRACHPSLPSSAGSP